MRTSWWSSGWDSTLSMQGAYIGSLVRELDTTYHNSVLRLQLKAPAAAAAAAAAAAKSLQSCPTLCDPIDGSPPGSPIPGILQARTLEWVAISPSST